MAVWKVITDDGEFEIEADSHARESYLNSRDPAFIVFKKEDGTVTGFYKASAFKGALIVAGSAAPSQQTGPSDVPGSLDPTP